MIKNSHLPVDTEIMGKSTIYPVSKWQGDLMKKRREYVRTPSSAPVKVIHPEFGERTFKMRDMSNGGVFLLIGNDLPLPKGSVVSIQVQGMLVDAPILEAEIIRKDADGAALKFL